MSAPSPGIQPAEGPAADALLSAFKGISESERQRHEAVLQYWLSIRGSRELPPLHDLDPLEISDAGPSSILLELSGSGEDAEIRHLGEKLKPDAGIDKISEAPRPSLLSSVAKKLSMVAISREPLAFEDEFTAGGVTTRCWFTLLPLSSAGAWVDYVYALVTFETETAATAKPAQVTKDEAETADPTSTEVEDAPEPVVIEEAAEAPLELSEPAEVAEEGSEAATPEPTAVETVETAPEPEQAAQEEPKTVEPAKSKASFSFDGDAAAGGFYASKAVNAELTFPEENPPEQEIQTPAPETASADHEAEPDIAPVEEAPEPASVAVPADEPLELATPIAASANENIAQPSCPQEGSLQTKLAEVRSKADEARMAKLRANAALYEGLSAAYDFALDAEDSPEEYLKLVESQGLKIQLRSPMRPVVKLAFAGMCDDSTITHLEAVLAWAFDQELPRGSLAGKLEEAGGIAGILNGDAQAN
jgi:hypothetical protein